MQNNAIRKNKTIPTKKYSQIMTHRQIAWLTNKDKQIVPIDATQEQNTSGPSEWLFLKIPNQCKFDVPAFHHLKGCIWMVENRHPHAWSRALRSTGCLLMNGSNTRETCAVAQAAHRALQSNSDSNTCRFVVTNFTLNMKDSLSKNAPQHNNRTF